MFMRSARIAISRSISSAPKSYHYIPARSLTEDATTKSLPVASTSTNSQLPRPNPPKGPKPAKVTSHKPPRKRLEAASAPLRSNPPPTRGPVLSCIAHTTAERYDLVALGLKLRSLGINWNEVPEGDKERALVIGPWKGREGAERMISRRGALRRAIDADVVEAVEAGSSTDSGDMGFGYGQQGEIWVFNSGSFVTWGLTEEEGKAFLRDVIRGEGLVLEIESLPHKKFEVEEVDFVVDPTAKTHILGNLILLGQAPVLSTFTPSQSLASLLARYTLSLSLTRSSSLSVLEDRLDAHIASVSTLPGKLMTTGAQPMGRKEVIRKIGELMVLRMAVNTRGGGLDDTPEFYWSEPELEDYFDSIATEFEIKERIDAINKKIDYAQEVQNTLRALLTEASGHRMEVIIILLIAVEVVVVLIREGPELYHKAHHAIAELIESFSDVDQTPTPGEVISEEIPKIGESLKRMSPLGLGIGRIEYDEIWEGERRLV